MWKKQAPSALQKNLLQLYPIIVNIGIPYKNTPSHEREQKLKQTEW